MLKGFEKTLRKPRWMHKAEEEKSVFIYLLKCQDLIKIGLSKNLPKRIQQIENQIPFDIELVFSRKILSRNAYIYEKGLHDFYQGKRVKGEWFRLTEKEIKELIQRLKNER
jgi:hypothetical protein